MHQKLHDHYLRDDRRHLECHMMAREPVSPAERKKERRLMIALAITLITMFLEAVGGWWTGSLALISDAGHMFSHLFALGISLVALKLAHRQADESYSFGLYRAEILAAAVNGLTLLAIVGWIGYEAYQRFVHPEAINSFWMFVIAAIGLIVNAVTAILLKSVSADDINVKGAFLHVLGDLFSSVGVIGAAILILFTGWTPADPIASVLIASVIAFWSFGLLRDAVKILLQSTPAGISHQAIAGALTEAIPEIHSVHHIHIWELTKNMYVLTAHVDLDDMLLSEADAIRRRAQDILHNRFHITHADLQLQTKHL